MGNLRLGSQDADHILVTIAEGIFLCDHTARFETVAVKAMCRIPKDDGFPIASRLVLGYDPDHLPETTSPDLPRLWRAWEVWMAAACGKPRYNVTRSGNGYSFGTDDLKPDQVITASDVERAADDLGVWSMLEAVFDKGVPLDDVAV